MNQRADDRPDPKKMSLIYTADEDYQPTDKEQEDFRLYPYMPCASLRKAVNLAIYLHRPLLIKGEPGSGKTRLAYAVAHEFSQTYYEELKALEYPGDWGDEVDENGKRTGRVEEVDDKGYKGWPFFFWSVKSTSRAQDGLYVYDAVGRLHDANLPEKAKKQEKVENYIEYGPLGKAFQMKVMRPIVLIDEIDKADIDFPNDLLIELEDPKFKVKELKNKEINGVVDPIIFVTSNDEKDLPDAFLRRCIFYYIEFPGPENLQDIIRRRAPDADEDLVKEAVRVFIDLRKGLREKKGTARKLPSTSELIDWVKALDRNTTNKEDQALSAEDFQEKQEAGKLLAEFENMDKGAQLMVDQVKNLLADGPLPFLNVLIKNWNDYEQYLEKYKPAENGQPGNGDEPDGGQA